MADTYDLIIGDASVSFADAKEAGAAFFKADVNQRPYVTHTTETGTRAVAGTIVELPVGRAPLYTKSLPAADMDSRNADFRHGFNEAERLASGRDTANGISNGDELERSDVNPVRVGQWPKSAPAPAELMRLYVKEGNRYTLHLESDFQSVIKEAEIVYGGGMDILVNEKVNPLVVHLKSNLHKDVDVGREISPPERNGEYVRGQGEVLLSSFFEKLPLVDRTPTERAPSQSDNSGPSDIKTPASKQQEPVKTTNNPGKAAKVLLDKGEVDTESVKDEDRRPILKRTGYELPAHLIDAYTVKSGRFLDKVSEKVHFEDHGRKLSTALEDKTVIAHMVDVAVAKKWDNLTLTGTLSFRQQAWLESESRGIRTTGYEPTKQDLQQLAELRSARGVTDSMTAKNQVEVSAERQVDTKSVPTKGAESAMPAIRHSNPGKQQPNHAPGTEQLAKSEERVRVADSKRNIEEAVREQADTPTAPNQQVGIIVGRLAAHGRDNFNHDPDEKPSYFVTLETHLGERKIWGKDLERSMSAGVFEKGDEIWLERHGAVEVTVDANVRDDQGKVIGKEEIAAKRNVWDVKPAGLVVIRDRSPEERVKVEAAYKVVEQAMQEYPAALRRELLQRFTNSVVKGEVDIPMPQVAEKTAQPEKGRELSRELATELAPEPELERGD
jgi:hypothetical protein